MILGLRQEIYTMSLEHSVVPESSKVIKENIIMGLCQRDKTT